MKKRMMFAAAVLSIGLMATPISAEDVTAGLDLDSMSVEDLVLLRDAVNQKIGEKGGDNILGKGVYEVGVDIKAGRYKFTCAPYTEYGFANLCVYNSKEEYDQDESKDNFEDVVQLDYDEESDGQNPGMLSLKDGQALYISTGSAIIEEIDASWAPEE